MKLSENTGKLLGKKLDAAGIIKTCSPAQHQASVVKDGQLIAVLKQGPSDTTKEMISRLQCVITPVPEALQDHNLNRLLGQACIARWETRYKQRNWDARHKSAHLEFEQTLKFLDKVMVRTVQELARSPLANNLDHLRLSDVPEHDLEDTIAPIKSYIAGATAFGRKTAVPSIPDHCQRKEPQTVTIS